jgi:hypothetical protein
MTAPVRRRPGASPIQSLIPHVEEVRTAHIEDSAPAPTLTAVPALVETEPATPKSAAAQLSQETAAHEEPDTSPRSFTTTAPAAPSTPAAPLAPAAAAPVAAESDEKKATTLAIRRSVKARAETAVLRTAGFDGGYKSWAAFVEGALERELERLEQEFNDGKRFPANTGAFRQGRPLGS